MDGNIIAKTPSRVNYTEKEKETIIYNGKKAELGW